MITLELNTAIITSMITAISGITIAALSIFGKKKDKQEGGNIPHQYKEITLSLINDRLDLISDELSLMKDMIKKIMDILIIDR